MEDDHYNYLGRSLVAEFGHARFDITNAVAALDPSAGHFFRWAGSRRAAQAAHQAIAVPLRWAQELHARGDGSLLALLVLAKAAGPGRPSMVMLAGESTPRRMEVVAIRAGGADVLLAYDERLQAGLPLRVDVGSDGVRGVDCPALPSDAFVAPQLGELLLARSVDGAAVTQRELSRTTSVVGMLHGLVASGDATIGDLRTELLRRRFVRTLGPLRRAAVLQLLSAHGTGGHEIRTRVSAGPDLHLNLQVAGRRLHVRIDSKGDLWLVGPAAA